MMETIILTNAATVNGRRLTYVVEGHPDEVVDDVAEVMNRRDFFVVPDRDHGGECYVNPFQIVSIYEKRG